MSRLIKTIADGETTYREAKQFWVSKSMIGESYDRFAHDAEQYDDDIPVVELAYCEQLEAKNAQLKEALEFYNHEGWNGPAKQAIAKIRDEKCLK